MEKLKYYSREESNIMVKHKMVKDKEEENKYGLMELFMMDYGKMTWQMVKESFINKVEDIMKEILKMINFMDTENLLQLIKISFMKVNFLNINHMASVRKYLLLKITNTQEILNSI